MGPLPCQCFGCELKGGGGVGGWPAGYEFLEAEEAGCADMLYPAFVCACAFTGTPLRGTVRSVF